MSRSAGPVGGPAALALMAYGVDRRPAHPLLAPRVAQVEGRPPAAARGPLPADRGLTSPTVSLDLDPPGPARRRQALGPLLLAPLLGVVGPLLLWLALVVHLALPVTVAFHLVRDGRTRFAAEDAPRIAEAIEWLLAVCGWASLVTTRAPWHPAPRGIRLRVPPCPPPPSPSRALSRLATGLPAALGQVVVAAVALVPWLALVACLIIAGRRPGRLWRLQVRVLARYARLVCRHAMIIGPHCAGGRSTIE